MKILLLLSFISFFAHASPEKKVETLLSELDQILDGSKLICDENYSKASLQERACEDLFQAACLDTQGQSRYEGRMEKLSVDITERIQKKRDEISKEFFGADFKEASKKYFKEAGIELSSDVDDYELNRFLRNPDQYYDMSKILESSQSCEALFLNPVFDELSLEEKVSSIKKMNEEAKRLDAQNKKLSSKFIEELVNSKSSDCRFKKNSPECSEIGTMKREALMLSRLKGSPDYTKNFNQFYDKHFKYEDIHVLSNEESVLSAYEKILEAGEKQCGRSEVAHSANARQIAKAFVGQVQFSKPFIDFVLDEFYSDKRKDEATKLFEFAKSSMMESLGDKVKDREKYKKIEESYSKLKLHWLDKPQVQDYSTYGKVNLLKVSDKLTLADNTIYHAFADPGLHYFSDFNANYMSEQSRGGVVEASRVDMQPAMLTLLDTNPLAFLEVLGHEVAHKVGPEVSGWNGFDLTKEHEELISCLSRPDSIALTPNQTDEAICDYFSAMILARYIETLPKERRLDAVVQSVEAYCMFDSHYMPTERDSHPDPYMRISGILGTNPKIRNLLGCEADSTKFRTCGVR